MNTKERYKVIIRSILEIKNNIIRNRELEDIINENILKKEYDAPSWLTKQDQEIVKNAIAELVKEKYCSIEETSNDELSELKYKDVCIYLHDDNYWYEDIIDAYKDKDGYYND